MGCDIHMYVEKKKDGKWAAARSELFVIEDEQYDIVPDIPYEQMIYTDRNYSLFAILANVRNGFGFAGSDTGEGFVPITMPKGLPDDVSEEVKKVSDEWGCDGHSHSWFTLEELLSYDWTQITVRRGWVNGLQYWDWCRYSRGAGESPESWCSSVGGGRVVHLTVDKMDTLIKMYTEDKQTHQEKKKAIEKYLAHTYCKIEWKQPYYKCVRRFLSDVIPQLIRMGKPDEVRIVFWFDN